MPFLFFRNAKNQIKHLTRMTKPIHLLKRIVNFIRENDIRTDHVSRLEYQNFQETLEQLDNYLNTNLPNIENVHLTLDLCYSGVIHQGRKYKGYTLLKATIENGLLMIRMESGMNKYKPDEVVSLYHFLHQDGEIFPLHNEEEHGRLAYKRIEEFLNVEQNQHIDYNDFYEATITFSGTESLLYIDDELLIQIKNVLEIYLNKGKGINADFLRVESLLRSLNRLPIVPKEEHYFGMGFNDDKEFSISLDDSTFEISESEDGDFNDDLFQVKYKIESPYREVEGNINNLNVLLDKMLLQPEAIEVFKFPVITHILEVVGDWKINDTDNFLNIKEKEADFYNNAGYNGQMKFQNIEANIDGQTQVFGDEYRFDFTFVGVRDFQPVSGAGWLSRNDDKLIGQIKIHGDNPKSITLSD